MSDARRQSTRAAVRYPEWPAVLDIRARVLVPRPGETRLLPRGAADGEETLEQPALRELHEETSLAGAGVSVGFLDSLDTEFDLGGRLRVPRDAVVFQPVDRARGRHGRALCRGRARFRVARCRERGASIDALSSGLPLHPAPLRVLLEGIDRDLDRDVNEPYAFEAQVGLYDTTLRDGEQTVGVVLDPQQKLEIARALAEAGVERIEAGFPRVSQDDWDAVRLIADAGLAPRSGASRARSRPTPRRSSSSASRRA